MICTDMQPLSIVHNWGFKTFVAAWDYCYNLPCRKILSNVSLRNLYDEDQKRVVQSVHVTGFTVHFMVWKESYEQLSLHYKSLRCSSFMSTHTAVNIKVLIEHDSDDLKLRDKLVTISTDNENNVEAAVEGPKFKAVNRVLCTFIEFDGRRGFPPSSG
ncbi:unnamed protein product [Lepeophtheirus salmonis]|uniref:(salmon louse) hypothetical protein n=1 Tax=Lepeophtheirus salmonis TaxID=72036 RepID=A0A817FED4_LEPSM|nr:unnamed protein product [Lepeophtheirus salmonis]CAG9477485.1 unnamed protein product [Lepeophtheirus salmonis]